MLGAVAPQIPGPSPLRAAAKPPVPPTDPDDALDDTWDATIFLTYGTVSKVEAQVNDAQQAKKHPIGELPTPHLDRPFVMVPGWTTGPDALEPLASHLTRNQSNGGLTYFVKNGAFYTQDPKGNLLPVAGAPKDARVFEMVWSDTHQSPEHNLPELKENLNAITKATGFDKVDAQGYSMGGLDTRLYLEQGGNQINRFMMLGTPNHGTSFGSMVVHVLDNKVEWASKLAGVGANDRESMEWLRDEAHSPELQQLNADWGRELSQVQQAIIVGTDQLSTPTSHALGGMGPGDGTVPAGSLPLPNVKTVLVHEPMSHGSLNADESIEKLRDDFFGWRLS